MNSDPFPYMGALTSMWILCIAISVKDSGTERKGPCECSGTSTGSSEGLRSSFSPNFSSSVFGIYTLLKQIDRVG